MTNQNKHLSVVSNQSTREIQSSHDDEDKKARTLQALMIGGTALAIGGAGGILGGNGGGADVKSFVSAKAPVPKVAKLSQEQTSRTTLPLPMPMAELKSLPSVEVQAEPNFGPWDLAKEVDGIIPNPDLRHEVQSYIQTEANEATGGVIKNDYYPVPILPEDLMGPDHANLPADAMQEANSVEARADLPINPAAVSGTHN